MLLDALLRHEPLENPHTSIVAEMAETDASGRLSVPIAPESAMKLAAVYACITVLASNMAQIPLHVMRKSAKGVAAARPFISSMMRRMYGKPATSGVS